MFLDSEDVIFCELSRWCSFSLDGAQRNIERTDLKRRMKTIGNTFEEK